MAKRTLRSMNRSKKRSSAVSASGRSISGRSKTRGTLARGTHATAKRGFAAMSAAKRKSIAAKGGRASRKAA